MIKIRNNILPSGSNLNFYGVEIKSPIPNACPVAVATVGEITVVIFQNSSGGFSGLSPGNAFGFNREGKLVWAAQPPSEAQEKLFEDCYIQFTIDEKTGELLLGTALERNFFLNLDEGTVMPASGGRWSRRRYEGPLIDIRNNITEAESRVKFHGIELKSPIPHAIPRATATLKDKIIVIFHYPINQFRNLSTANAFAFDKKGDILWTVEAYAPYQDLCKDNYVDFSVDERGLILGTFIGHQAYLNTDNGRITAINVGRAW